jgi:HD-GYP domain-containing protein (c-di-GMP phosphodiesterase class II)
MSRSESAFDPVVGEASIAARERRPQPLSPRELVGDGAFAVAFVGIALALPILSGGASHVGVGVALAYVLAYAAATQVEFHTGTGFAVPTQLVFVPMLFALPPEIVPLLVGIGCVAGRLPHIVRGRIGRDRWLVALADGWFSIAPAAIFAAADPGAPAWSDAGLYALAFGAQFAGDAAVNAVRGEIVLGVSSWQVLREMPYVHRVDALLTPIGLLAAIPAAHGGWGGLLTLPLTLLFAIFARERDARVDGQLELERAYRGTAMLLGDVIEHDDAYTAHHTRGVVGLAVAVAGELDLGPRERREIELGALLHDVGKLRIPNEIINKPGPLDHEEWAVMRTHTVEGQRMLERIGGLLGRVGVVVRASHERWDGTGYPDGLAGDDIPLAARIVAACDALSAMTTDRSYRPAMAASAAREELVRHAGTQFDPGIVAALLRVMDQPAVAAQERPALDGPLPATS